MFALCQQLFHADMCTHLIHVSPTVDNQAFLISDSLMLSWNVAVRCSLHLSLATIELDPNESLAAGARVSHKNAHRDLAVEGGGRFSTWLAESALRLRPQALKEDLMCLFLDAFYKPLLRNSFFPVVWQVMVPANSVKNLPLKIKDLITKLSIL